jgi:hypothetical protein
MWAIAFSNFLNRRVTATARKLAASKPLSLVSITRIVFIEIGKAKFRVYSNVSVHCLV